MLNYKKFFYGVIFASQLFSTVSCMDNDFQREEVPVLDPVHTLSLPFYGMWYSYIKRLDDTLMCTVFYQGWTERIDDMRQLRNLEQRERIYEVNIINYQTGKKAYEPTIIQGHGLCMGFLRFDDQRFFISFQDGTVYMCNYLLTGEWILVRVNQSWTGVLAKYDDEHLIITDQNNDIVIWNYKTKKRYKTLEGNEGSVVGLIKLNNRYLASLAYAFENNGDRAPSEIRIWDLETGQTSYMINQRARYIAEEYPLICLDEGFIARINSSDTLSNRKSDIIVIDYKDDISWFIEKANDLVYSLANDPGTGRIAISFKQSSNIRLWDYRTGQYSTTIPNPESNTKLSYLSESMLVALYINDDHPEMNCARLWDYENQPNSEYLTLEGVDLVSGFTPGFLVARGKNFLDVWNYNQRLKLYTLAPAPEYVGSNVSIRSLYNGYFATINEYGDSTDRTLCIWQLSSDDEVEDGQRNSAWSLRKYV